MEAPNYRIGVLAYGSIPNELYSQHYKCALDVEAPEGKKPTVGNLNADSPFVLAEGLRLPVRFGRISSAHQANRRITAVIAKDAQEVDVLYALSKYKSLPDALKNLAKREGCSESTKLMGFVDVRKPDAQSRLANVAVKIAVWAIANKLDAVIWADFPEKDCPLGQEIATLKRDRDLLVNTKAYVRSVAMPLGSMADEILNLPES